MWFDRKEGMKLRELAAKYRLSKTGVYLICDKVERRQRALLLDDYMRLAPILDDIKEMALSIDVNQTISIVRGKK
jgi:hypothetical protein